MIDTYGCRIEHYTSQSYLLLPRELEGIHLLRIHLERTCRTILVSIPAGKDSLSEVPWGYSYIATVMLQLVMHDR